ncbi:HNH endonuclease [Deinococcus sp. S9]|uniref:HNH endonuclease n=1 Tax=Deinococcus sp. S9 TaxID=2545754 RepID=UPI00105526A1|nr:hypothetical protein [Deinococcus sp. S9]TDE84688.1 hypothetical protein E0686_15820 [Deinococcus sp. S9]
MKTKQCAECHQVKNEEEFYFTASGKRASKCKACVRTYQKERRERGDGVHKGGSRSLGNKQKYIPKLKPIREENALLERQGLKRCFRCREVKPLNGYEFARAWRDGVEIFQQTCHTCTCQGDSNKIAALRELEDRRLMWREAHTQPEEVKAHKDYLHKKGWHAKRRQEREERRAALLLQGLCECRSCGRAKPFDGDHFIWNKKEKRLTNKCLDCSTAKEPERQPKPRRRLTEEEVRANKQAADTRRRRARGIEPRQLLSPEEREAREREQRRNARRRRKARERGAEGQYTEAEFLAQRNRQEHRCYWTGIPLPEAREEYHADHVIPLRYGGTNWISNIVAASKIANEAKRELMPWDWLGVTFCEWTKACRNHNGPLSPIQYEERPRDRLQIARFRKRYTQYPTYWISFPQAAD